MAAQPRRVRRPKDKEKVIQAVLATKENPGTFGEIRDVLTFAATLGFRHKRRTPFTATGEQIRWDTFTNRYGTEDLVGMIAVGASDDREIVADDRFDEQILIFEEYMNGGLEYLDALLQKSKQFPRDAILELVQTELAEQAGDDPLGLGL